MSNLWELEEHHWEHKNLIHQWGCPLNEILSRTLNPRNSSPEFMSEDLDLELFLSGS
jgi:hypothetical protein